MYGWMNEWMDKYMRMNEWMNEWVVQLMNAQPPITEMKEHVISLILQLHALLFGIKRKQAVQEAVWQDVHIPAYRPVCIFQPPVLPLPVFTLSCCRSQGMPSQHGGQYPSSSTQNMMQRSGGFRGYTVTVAGGPSGGTAAFGYLPSIWLPHIL